jgi:CBS domain containing-hemolysin-like protein
MDRLGWVPRSGDRIEVEGLALEVERMDGRRVDRLRLTRTQGQQMGGHR